MLRHGSQWVPTDWQTALEFVATGLKRIVAEIDPQAFVSIGVTQEVLGSGFARLRP